PGKSIRTSMPSRKRSAAGPLPANLSNCGDAYGFAIGISTLGAGFSCANILDTDRTRAFEQYARCLRVASQREARIGFHRIDKRARSAAAPTLERRRLNETDAFLFPTIRVRYVAHTHALERV